jgi:hypothetical protein
MNITLSYLRFNIDSKLFGCISNSLNRSCRAQNLVSNKTGFVIFGISYYFLLILQVSSITSHEIISTLTQRSSNSTVPMGLDFAENTLTLSQLLHRVLHMNWKQRRCSVRLGSGGRRSRRGPGSSSGTPGVHFRSQKVRRKTGRRPSVLGGAELRGAGSSGRAPRRQPRRA